MPIDQSCIIFWKKVTIGRYDADQKVSLGPAYLIAARLAAGTGGAATANIYDGHSTNEEAKINLAAITSGNDNFCPSIPMPFTKGLYLDVGNNVTSVTLVYLSLSE